MKSHCQRPAAAIIFSIRGISTFPSTSERPSPVQENLIRGPCAHPQDGGKLTVAVAKITTAWANYRSTGIVTRWRTDFSTPNDGVKPPLLGLRIIQLCLRRFAAPLCTFHAVTANFQ